MFRLVLSLVALLLGCQKALVPTEGAPPKTGGPAMTSEGEVGNGGHGIKIGGKIYLYDLWEAGIEAGPRHPFERAELEKAMVHQRVGGRGGGIAVGKIPSDKYTSAFFADEIGRAFTSDELKPIVEAVADRLSVIFELDPVLAMSLCESIRAHSWVVTSVELGRLKLPDPVHDLTERQVVLLANRSGRFIYMFSKYWTLLDAWNRVGLVLHEAIYSLLPPLKVALPNGGETLRQDGKRARQILALLSGVKSLATLFHGGLEGDINRDELPLLLDSDARTFDVTSTFFTRIRRVLSPPSTDNRLALVGPAKYRLVLPKEGTRVEFKLPAFSLPSMAEARKKEHRELLLEACEKLARKPTIEYQIEMEFSGSELGGSGYMLQTGYYQEREELKQYLRFTPLKAPMIQVASRGTSEVFFDIARPLDPAAFGKAPEESEVVKACQNYLSGVTGRAGFYFPARFPLDPELRYGH